MSSTATVGSAGPHAGLLAWLARHAVEYEVREHPLTFTARETARVEGVDPRRFAKTLVLQLEGVGPVFVVLDAIDHLDFERTCRLLGGQVRLLTESELCDLCPDCDTGTTPPIGELWGAPVFADFALREHPEITFHAGSHRFTVTVERAAWEKSVRAIYCDLAVKEDGAPVWDR
jgi:prolyl-tRNA editing enzyme YbaK/EbsC (Cys-tRNA(Pro) deacylase)